MKAQKISWQIAETDEIFAAGVRSLLQDRDTLICQDSDFPGFYVFVNDKLLFAIYLFKDQIRSILTRKLKKFAISGKIIVQFEDSYGSQELKHFSVNFLHESKLNISTEELGQIVADTLNQLTV